MQNAKCNKRRTYCVKNSFDASKVGLKLLDAGSKLDVQISRST